MNYFIHLAVPFVIALLITPIVIIVAKKKKWLAKTNERTVHKGEIPAVGGIAIYIAFVLSMILFFPLNPRIIAFLVSSSILFFVGLYDDIYDMPALVKFSFQILATLIVVYFGGVMISKLNLPFGFIIDNKLVLGLISLVWIIGVINAINLIDGLDGLATGISSIVLITACLISFSFTFSGNIYLMLVLLGALLGFLRYNFYPASIFLGDCGSQFVGLLLGAFTIVSFKSSAIITLIIPFVILFIPLMDSVVTIIRRKTSGKKITSADKSHLHHILMFNLDLGHRRTVLVMYFVTAVFGLTAWIYRYDSLIGTIILFFLILLYEIFIEYTEMINPKYKPILSVFNRITRKK